MDCKENYTFFLSTLRTAFSHTIQPATWNRPLKATFCAPTFRGEVGVN